MENSSWFIQTFSAENRLSTVTKLASGDCSTPGANQAVWEFSYDGDGTRVAQAYTPYDGNGNPQATVVTAYFMGGAYEVTGSSVRKYYAVAGMTVAMNDGTGLKYLLTDHLGSVVAITDNSGTLINQQRYLPFGQVRTDAYVSNSPITGTDFGFTGQRSNSYINLVDYKSRWYDAELGRFVSPDDIIPDLSNPQTFNRYSYSNNSPIVYNDPTGHDGICFPYIICPVTTPRAPVPTGINLTQWLIARLNENVNATATQTMKKDWKSGNAVQMTSALNTFTSFVEPHGIWDYKDDIALNPKLARDNATATLGNRNVPISSVANINFGYMAAYIGISEDIAERGAGLAQRMNNCPFGGKLGTKCSGGGTEATYGDNPNDNYWIKYGYHLERSTSSESGHLTIEDLTNNLDDYMHPKTIRGLR